MKKLTWLASYPKSGNTWTRAFLAAYHFQLPARLVLNRAMGMTRSESRLREFIDLTSVQKIELTEQDVDSLRDEVQQRLTGILKPYQLIKTHNARIAHNGFTLICTRYTRAAVYLVRNPLDVVDSLADHANLTIDEAIGLMNDPGNQLGSSQTELVTQYVHTWSTHVLSWTRQQDFPVHVIRYEDLQSSPLETFRGLVQFLGWEFDETRLERAIENSSFDVLRRSEQIGGFAECSDIAKSGRFFRKGRSNRWHEVLTKEQAKRIVEDHGEVMEQFGYDLDVENQVFIASDSNDETNGTTINGTTIKGTAGIRGRQMSRVSKNSTASENRRTDLTALSESSNEESRRPLPSLQEAIDLHQSGNLSEAKESYEAILEAKAEHCQAIHLLGVVYHQMGESRHAIDLISQAIALQPDNGVFYSNRGAAHLALRNWSLARADYAIAIQFEPTLPDAHNGLAVVCNETGRVEEAAEYFRSAIQHRPHFPEAHKNLGNALVKLGRFEEGIEHLRKAVELRPVFAEAHGNLGQLMNQVGNVEAAIHHLEIAVRQKNDNIAYQYDLGAAYMASAGRVDDAQRCFQTVLSQEPNHVEAINGMAATLVASGKIDSAIEHCCKVLQLRSFHPMALINLSELASQGHYSFSEAEIDAIQGVISSKELPENEAAVLHHVLATHYDRAAQYDTAFSHYEMFNAASRTAFTNRGLRFDRNQHARTIDDVISTFDESLFAKFHDFGSESTRPIFVVGMPRSGTTLVEQILARHEGVFGAGEQRRINNFARSLGHAFDAGYPACVAQLDKNRIQSAAQGYLNWISRLAPSATYVVDKMPSNFVHLGLIAILFPHSRIVHCRRDARDVCVSCYTQNFRSVVYATDCEDLAAYYQQYDRLMKHWREVLPMQMKEVQYEQIVKAPEQHVRELAEFCSIPWSEQLLEFHTSATAVQTASKMQVRKPIYQSAVGRWQRFQSQLAHLFSLLENSVDCVEK